MKVVFFSPHSGIWVHGFPEALVADSLKKLGHDIHYITCDRIFNNYCITMSAFGIQPDSSDEKKKEICDTCNRRRDFTLNSFHFASSNIGKYIDENEISKVKKLSSEILFSRLTDYTEDGVEVGKSSVYELLLKFKKSSFDFNENQTSYIQNSFMSSLISKRASDKWIENLRPDAVIIYNTNYAVNRSVALNCIQRKIPVYSIHAGDIISDRLSRLMIAQDNLLKNCYDIKSSFTKNQKEGLFKLKSIKEYLDHQKMLLSGKHFLVYSSGVDSSKKTIREFFGINHKQKILVATMSSYDEMFAAIACGLVRFNNTAIFQSQIEWLKELINFIESREDYFLIIRVHPREFPNKRESYSSNHGVEVKNALEKLPKNCRLNIPEDNTSLYSLALEANLILNAWSSAGEEMALFGIPVLLYDSEMTLYPHEINFLAKTKTDYFEKIISLSDKKISKKEILESLKWISFRLNYTTFSLEESYSEKPISERKISFFQKLKLRFLNWKNRNKQYSEEELDFRLKSDRLNVSIFLETLIKNKKENLFQIEEFKKSFKDDNETEVLNYYLRNFYELLTESFSSDIFQNSLLKKRWDILLSKE
ncbi:MAG: hypothetical protein SFU98_15160 [Leptospiraceae bacterium]|nr:hypothetical protein [Leptospiraceae bacterium]